MKKNQTVPKEVKEQIIERIRNEGKSVSSIDKEHGIPPTTVFSWLKRQTENPQYYREVVKLRKEKQTLLELIGKLTMDLSVLEKKELPK